MEGNGLLELPAGLAVRWVALRLLDQAAAAHARLADPADKAALHAFRVALRRLRGTLRGYRGVLADSVGGRDRRRLAELAGATGAARDAEVRVAWIETAVKRARGDERAILRASLPPARGAATEARSELIEAAENFPRERRRLRRALRDYEARVRADEPPGGVPFRRVLATRLREAVAGVASHLAAVLGEARQAEAHDARTAAKRLRYLLEPVRDDLPGARDVLKELKGLQDVLGEMHDAHVMLALAAGEGEVAAPVRERLEVERSKRFAALRAGWLEGAAEPFAARVLALAVTLEGGGAGVEIERKYLLRGMPRLDAGVEVRDIEQGYIPGDRLAERVRRVRTPEGTRWYRTVKLGA
ncbi:MAG TPA: CHAD domain-containing protein, partial [Longimicrobium sp.]|nr:CHAD domain-containing protein [Longimicrobium sp.]